MMIKGIGKAYFVTLSTFTFSQRFGTTGLKILHIEYRILISLVLCAQRACRCRLSTTIKHWCLELEREGPTAALQPVWAPLPCETEPRGTVQVSLTSGASITLAIYESRVVRGARGAASKPRDQMRKLPDRESVAEKRGEWRCRRPFVFWAAAGLYYSLLLNNTSIEEKTTVPVTCTVRSTTSPCRE